MNIEIRQLDESELQVGLELAMAAGWNQTSTDWNRQFQLCPAGCFAALVDGHVVGTVAACTFGSVGWIAMMLVHESFRRQGIGRQLMKQAIEFLESNEVTSIRLDATPLGAPLYETLGFQPQFELRRFDGVAPVSDSTAHESTPCDESMQAMLDIDRSVYGYDRQQLFEQYMAESTSTLREHPEQTAFSVTRAGRLATYIGPCIARTPSAGQQTLSATLAAASGRLFVDIPVTNRLAAECAVASGLQPTRRLMRMTRGALIEENQQLVFSSSGPEKG